MELDEGIVFMTIFELVMDHGRYSGTSVADGDGAILIRICP